jgi:hypothetical protein
MHQLRRFLLVLGLSLLGACGSSDSTSGKTGGASSEVTFHRDVRPLLETHCAGCHVTGGIAPFALGFTESEWKDGTPSWAADAVKAVEERRMPPWMPDPECHELTGSRRLSDEDVDVFKAWADNKFAQGDESEYRAPNEQPLDLGPASVEIAPKEAYTPNAKLSDDYRCFLLPHTFEEESFATASSVVPGVVHEVHHVILFGIDGAQASVAQALDDKEAGPGYTCFGGPGVDGAANIGGWVPGMVPNVAPDGAARVLPKGSRIIMQVHYNMAHAADQGVHADRTSTQLWLMKAGEKPKYRLTTFPLANLDIKIAAGDGNSVQTRMLTAPMEGTLVGVLPHMHTHGKRIEVTLKRDAGDMCLVRIPAWDFHWQQGYRYDAKAYVELERGEPLELTCVYDNSQGKKDVYWGEGTSDEMCLNYLEIRTPYRGKTLASECPTYEGCVQAASDLASFIGCTTATPQCQSCTGSGLARCAVGRCQDEGLGFQACAGMCAGDNACVKSKCLRESIAFFSCMEPNVRDGSCDASFEACGL